MNENDKVTPIRPDIPGLQEFRRSDTPYTGPSDAVQDVLKNNKFDDFVKDRGWVEIRIVAQFSDVGAMFHTVQARQVELTPVDRPAFVILSMVAMTEDLPEDHYQKIATIEELTKLDELLARASVDQMIRIAAPDDHSAEALAGIDKDAVAEILLAITERG